MLVCSLRAVLTVLTALSIIALSVVASPSVHSSMTSSIQGPWPMFHGNAQHTGLSPYPGPTSPVLLWTFQTGSPIYASPVVGNGRIYVTSADGNLYALNPQGHLLWTFTTHEQPLFPSSPAIGPDGTVYVAGCLHCDQYNRTAPPEGVLYALNRAGGLKWNLTIPNSGEGYDTLTSPTIGPDGTIYVSDVGFRILAVNPDGSLKWEVYTNGEVVEPPAVAPDGTIYVDVDDPGPPIGPCVYFNKCLLALNPDGSVKWSLQTLGGFESPAVGPDGSVYIGGYAVSPSGTVEWENSVFSSPSVAADETIYGTIFGGDNRLSAVESNGTLKWQFHLPHSIGSINPCCLFTRLEMSSVAIGSNGLIIFGTATQHYCSYCGVTSSGNDTLYAVNPNGTLAWQFLINRSLAGVTDPAIGSGGTVYVGSSDGNLYAIS